MKVLGTHILAPVFPWVTYGLLDLLCLPQSTRLFHSFWMQRDRDPWGGPPLAASSVFTRPLRLRSTEKRYYLNFFHLPTPLTHPALDV